MSPTVPTTDALLRALPCFNADLELYPDRIIVHWKRLLSRLLPVTGPQETSVKLPQIVDIQVSHSTFLMDSLIRFTVEGEGQEDIVLLFDPKYMSIASQIKEIIEDFRSKEFTVPESVVA